MLEKLLQDVQIRAEDAIAQGVLTKRALRDITKIYLRVSDQIEKRKRESYAYDQLLLHSKNVACYSFDIVKRYSAKLTELQPKEISEIVIAAALHDIEKIYWPYELFCKPKSQITSHDFRRIRQHPVSGTILLKLATNYEISKNIIGIIAQHHENIDGTGYPEQKSGDEICLGARIVRVTDSYDTMTSERAYGNKRFSSRTAVEMIESSGGKYDRTIVMLFKDTISCEKN